VPDWPAAATANVNLTPIAASVCAAVLMMSAIGHLRARTLRYELAAHGVFPVRLRRFVPGGVMTAEGLLAVVLTCSLVTGGPILRSALGFSAVLFGCYLGYVLAVVFRAPEQPTSCGCGVGEHPIGVATAGRAAGLAVLAVVGALDDGSPLRTTGLFSSICMSISAICLLVWLPVSLARPHQLTVERGR
jgi:hypothetical protein